jgi:hypothetical protein
MSAFGVQVKQQNLPTRATTVSFFVKNKKNPLSFAGAFQIQVWWAFHPQTIVCFENISLCEYYSVKRIWSGCLNLSSRQQQQAVMDIHFMWRGRSINKEWQISFLFSAQALISLLISLCLFRMKRLGVESVAFCLSLWVCVCVCVRDRDRDL